MSKFNLFNPDEITVSSNLQAEKFIPKNVVRVMARDLADSAEEKIISRVSEGKFPGNPDGTGPVRKKRYSTGSRSFPLTRPEERSRTRQGRYEGMASRVQAGAENSEGASTFRSSSGRPWVHVPGGYARFRRMAGLPSGNVTLSFTGRLLEDLVVKPVIEQFGEEGVTVAATQVAGGKIESGSVLSGFQKSGNMDFELADVIAEINLKVGFSTQASWRIANWQARRYNNHFALLTPSEKTELKREGLRLAQKARSKYGTKSPSTAPRSESGQFIPIKL